MKTKPYFQNIQSVIGEYIKKAEKNIYVSVAWMTDQVLFNYLCERARKNVEVAVIIFDDSINERLDFSKLENFGGRIYKVGEKLMHNKFCVIDEKILITGSYNWTYSAAQGDREENIIIIDDGEELAEQYIEQFKNIITKYFSTNYQPNIKAFNASKVMKRLEIIKQLIDLEEYEDADKHVVKLRLYSLPFILTEIINDIQEENYEEVVVAIQQYQKLMTGLTTYIDPEIEQLKINIKILEIEISTSH